MAQQLSKGLWAPPADSGGIGSVGKRVRGVKTRRSPIPRAAHPGGRGGSRRPPRYADSGRYRLCRARPHRVRERRFSAAWQPRRSGHRRDEAGAFGGDSSVRIPGLKSPGARGFPESLAYFPGTGKGAWGISFLLSNSQILKFSNVGSHLRPWFVASDFRESGTPVTGPVTRLAAGEGRFPGPMPRAARIPEGTRMPGAWMTFRGGIDSLNLDPRRMPEGATRPVFAFQSRMDA